MAKLHDEQRGPEHDDLVAEIEKNKYEVAGLVYPKPQGAERQIKIDDKRNGGECDYVIVHVSDSKDWHELKSCLIIDARPELELDEFEAVAAGLETCQKKYYRDHHRNPSNRQDILDKDSLKVIATRSKPDFRLPKSADENVSNIYLIFQDEATRRFTLLKDTT